MAEFKKRKALPVGIASFSRIIEADYIYVDKTKYIYNLIRQGERYFLFRPRRFGKSLLISTLQELFSGNRKLFESLYIGKTDYTWEKHPVIVLRFSGIKARDASTLEKKIEYMLNKIAKQYGVDISDAPCINTKFDALITRLAEVNRVVVLIDEYDTPLIKNINNLERVDECREVLHDFFAVLKDVGDYLRFIFVTGVTKFSKTSVFSGLNNLDDLTFTSRASLLLGYTHDELISHFHPYIEDIARKNNSSTHEVLCTMKNWYNGYVFSEESFYENLGEQLVYNPFSVLLFLENKKLENYWASTGTPAFLVDILKTQNFAIPQMEGGEVNIDDTKAFELDTIKLLPILWQSGYLTIDSYDPVTQNYRLRFPNREVKTTFLNYLMGYLTKKDIAGIKKYTLQLSAAIESNNLEDFFTSLSIFFANIPYTIQMRQEKYYQSIFYTILSLIGARVTVEEATNKGRIDAVLETSSHIYIFEFKIDGSADTALKQIEDKQYY